MSELLLKLGPKQRKGSKPRCHWLTHGTSEQVATRLTKLIEPWGTVSIDAHWMPDGFTQTDEAELHKAARLLDDSSRNQIRDWWFAIVRGRQTAPSFDIASTCTVTVDGKERSGVLLVEAKAHDHELIKEEAGKTLAADASEGEQTNHAHIGAAIAWANTPLAASTNHQWSLSHKSRYQMSNRCASACKLTELGFPVILVYLGFLNAEEMRKGKSQSPLATHHDWETLVKAHSKPLFPAGIWNNQWTVHNQPFIPLIRSFDIPYDAPVVEVAT